MANPFDQFDDTAPASGGNPFDQFDANKTETSADFSAQPDDPSSPEGLAYAAKMQQELSNTQSARIANARYQNESGLMHGVRHFAKEGTFGWEPEILAAMNRAAGIRPGDETRDVAAEERAMNERFQAEHPYVAPAIGLAGNVTGAMGVGELLGAAPVTGKALDWAGSQLSRVPAITAKGRQLAAARAAAGEAAPVTIGRTAATAAAIGAPIGASERMADKGVTAENALEGGLESAAESAVAGPVLAHAAIPAARYLAAQVPVFPQTAMNALRTVVPGMRENIDQRLLMTARREGVTLDQLKARIQAEQDAAKFGPVQLNPYTTLADTGPAFQSLGYQTKSTSGPAKAYVENFLNARAKGSENVPGYNPPQVPGQPQLPQRPEIPGQYERVNEYTRRALQVTRDANAAKVEDRMTAGQQQGANQAYNAFRAFQGTIPVDDILQGHAADIASRLTTGSKLFGEIDKAYEPFTDEVHALGGEQGPSLTEQARYHIAQMQNDNRIANAIDAGNDDLVRHLQDLKEGMAKQFAAKTKDVNLTAPSYDLTPAKFDAAKQQLDDVIGKSIRDGDKYKASLLMDLKNKLVQRADEATAIHDAQGNPVLDANGDPRSLYRDARESYSMPQEELNALEAGRNFKSEDPDRIKQTMRDYDTPEKRAYRIGAANTIRNDLGEKGRGSNVATYFDKPNMETRMDALTSPRRAQQHADLMDIENRMAETRGKVNYGSRTEENKQGNEDFTMWTRLGRSLKSGRPLEAIGDLISTSLQHLYRFREQDAMNLARVLFETDPAKRLAVLNDLQARYGQRPVTEAQQVARQLANQYAGNMLSAAAASRAEPDSQAAATQQPRQLPPGYTPRAALDEARAKLAHNPGSSRVADEVERRLNLHGLTLKHPSPADLLAPPLPQ